jgi:Cytochrome C biogenesis protein
MRLLLAIAITLALAPPAAAACPTVADLEDELICPTCKTTLDQSDAPVARQIKAIVARRVEDCASKQQIKDELGAAAGGLPLARLGAAADRLARCGRRHLCPRLALESLAAGRGCRGLERPRAARSRARAPARPGARAL